ncbi:hypothetical protein BDW75DRAFT_5944 [Aspergillus navahoensis]
MFILYLALFVVWKRSSKLTLMTYFLDISKPFSNIYRTQVCQKVQRSYMGGGLVNSRFPDPPDPAAYKIQQPTTSMMHSSIQNAKSIERILSQFHKQ